MKDKNFISNEFLKQLTQSIESVGASLLNLVHFADNLVPEELTKNGLKHCINDLCMYLKQEYDIPINSTFNGEFPRLPETIEIQLFRIINNLFSFIVSQSKPGYIDLLVTQKQATFEIEISDNGKEFDVSGIGSQGIHQLAQLKSAVELLRGTFSFSRKTNTNKIVIAIHF